MLRWLAIVLFAAAFFWPIHAHACATCSAGDPTLDASGSEKPFAARKRLALDARATTAHAADVTIAEERLELRTDLALSPMLLVSAALPALHRSITTFDGAHSNEVVLGDAELRATAVVADTGIANVRRSILVFGGSKLPTSPLQTDAKGRDLPVALQPGCGSIDPMLGASIVLSHAPFTFVASTLFYLPFSVRAGPHAGDSWRTSFTLQVQLPGSVVATRFGISTRLDQAGLLTDREIDPDSGGFVTYVSGEVLVSPVRDLVLGLGMFAPAVQALRGSQHEGGIALATAAVDF